MTTFRVRDYLLPIRTLGYHRLMTSAPAWPRERVEAWSLERRRRVVEHAARTEPYYRDTLARLGIDASRADRPEVWERIPTVSKEDVRDHPERFVSTEAARHGGFWAATSGSSGMPMRILLDDNVNAAAFALFWRAWGSGGHWKLGQRQAAMKGTTHQSGWRYHRAIRTLEISAAWVDANSVETIRDVVRRVRPRFMRGYPSAMYVFCRLLHQAGLELHVPMVISGSETLHDFQREEIEGRLGARLYNHYTHWERAVSVLECERGSLHAQEDYGHVEILDKAGSPVPANAPGEIVATGLHNLAMPLIRYRTGDVSMWSSRPCACGQGFPVVERILGREVDYLARSDGSPIPATCATACFKEFPNVLYAQIAQDEPGRVELRLVPTGRYDDARDTPAIVARLRVQLGEDVAIDVRRCGLDRLERSPAGKIRACFNRIPRDRESGAGPTAARPGGEAVRVRQADPRRQDRESG